MSYAVRLVDGDDRAGIFLHLLYDFSARADDSTDELLRDVERHDARHVRLEFWTRLSDGVGDAVEDMLTPSLSLCESLLENLV